MINQRFSRWALVLLLYLGSSLSTSEQIAADSHLVLRAETKIYHMSELEQTKISRQHYWLGDKRINFELGPGRTMVIRFDLEKIYWIDHGKKEFEVFSLPFDIRARVTSKERQALDDFLETFKPIVKVERVEEVKETEKWGKAKLTRLEASYPDLVNRFNLDIWVSKDVPFDYQLYNRGLVLRRAVDPMMEARARHLGTLDGFGVEFVNTEYLRFYESVAHYTLEAVEEVEPREGLYEPPPGYREVSPDYSQFLP